MLNFGGNEYGKDDSRTYSETGFEALPDDIRQQRLDSTAKGYTTVLADLKAYLEGKELPY